MLANQFYILHDDGVCNLKDFIYANVCDDSCGHIEIEDVATIIKLNHGESAEFSWSMGGNKITRINALEFLTHPFNENPATPEHLALIKEVEKLTTEWFSICKDDDQSKISDIAHQHNMFFDDDEVELGSEIFYAYAEIEDLTNFRNALVTLIETKK